MLSKISTKFVRLYYISWGKSNKVDIVYFYYFFNYIISGSSTKSIVEFSYVKFLELLKGNGLIVLLFDEIHGKNVLAKESLEERNWLSFGNDADPLN